MKKYLIHLVKFNVSKCLLRARSNVTATGRESNELTVSVARDLCGSFFEQRWSCLLKLVLSIFVTSIASCYYLNCQNNDVCFGAVVVT